VSGWVSDRIGSRALATGGLLITGASFVALIFLPTNFDYWQFAVLIAINGIGSGLFAAPNTMAIMNSVPASQRGAASGMRGTFFNSGSCLSIGIFFSLMIAGLASTLPTTLTNGLTAQGVPAATAQQIGDLPPVGSLFAAFLGYNPMQSLLGPTGVLHQLPAANAAKLTGKEFFPQLISQPFHHGLVVVFIAAALMMLIGSVASLFRGGMYVHDDEASSAADGDRMGEDDPVEPLTTSPARS
jgi:MFS family permease